MKSGEGQCSFDARSGGATWPPSCGDVFHSGGGGKAGMETDDRLCSRNARPQKALVGRAQWKISQSPSLKRYRGSLEGLVSRCNL